MIDHLGNNPEKKRRSSKGGGEKFETKTRLRLDNSKIQYSASNETDDPSDKKYPVEL